MTAMSAFTPNFRRRLVARTGPEVDSPLFVVERLTADCQLTDPFAYVAALYVNRVARNEQCNARPIWRSGSLGPLRVLRRCLRAS